MLYFTSIRPVEKVQQNTIDAIYSGRFAFLDPTHNKHLVSALKKLASRDIFDAFFSYHPSSKREETVLEEFLHAKLLLNSYIGQSLNGLRLITRIKWLWYKSTQAVENYYKIRTLFYLCAYDAHENLAGGLISDLESSVKAKLATTTAKEKKQKITSTVRTIDKEIHNEIRAVLGKRTYYYFLLASPVYWSIGRVLSNSFTIITRHEGRDEHYGEGGIINAYSWEQLEKYWFLKFLRWLHFEWWFRNSVHDDWQWMVIKFATEKKQWEIFQNTQNINLPFTYREYKNLVMGFVGRWSNYKNAKSLYQINSAINLCSQGQKVPFPKENISSNPDFQKFVNFFYLHGN